MQKWQYMSVWVDRNWKVQTVVGYESEELGKLPAFVEFLNLIGLVGWELVSIVPVDVGHRAYFKRPKA